MLLKILPQNTFRNNFFSVAILITSVLHKIKAPCVKSFYIHIFSVIDLVHNSYEEYVSNKFDFMKHLKSRLMDQFDLFKAFIFGKTTFSSYEWKRFNKLFVITH